MKPVLRRLAALVLLVGGVLLGGRLLGVWGGGPVPVELHYLLGDPPRATALEVRFTRPGAADELARFQTSLIAPDVRQSTRLPAGTVALSITLTGPAGARAVTRTIEAERDAVIRLDLTRSLGGEAPQ